MKAIPLVLLCTALASGCVVSKRIDSGRPADDYGATVEVRRDGAILYEGRRVSREKLVRELKEDVFVQVRGRPSQRAVVLEGGSGVADERLVDLRRFLVANRIPNVAIRTARDFEAEVGGIGQDRLTPAQRTFRAMIEKDAAAVREP